MHMLTTNTKFNGLSSVIYRNGIVTTVTTKDTSENIT